MELSGIVPMDVVFSFDTTGSMSQALDEVKGRVMDIIQKLQADIPGVRVGIIAHGDYCDAEHFYDIRCLDLSDSVADVVTFVNETEGTGGGDIPECYELALYQAKNMSWRANSRRVLVMIGDAYPHEPDYPLNVRKINWKSELSDLATMNVRIYGVQVQNDPQSSDFFQELALTTEGQHLQLSGMGRVCEVIMGICYREQGPIMFQNYEAEIRHKEQEALEPDLECVFGTLRTELSRTSDITTILDRDEDEVDQVNMNDDEINGKNRVCSKDSIRPSLKRLCDSNNNEQVNEESIIPLPKKRRRMILTDDDSRLGSVLVPTSPSQSFSKNCKQSSLKQRYDSINDEDDEDDDYKIHLSKKKRRMFLTYEDSILGSSSGIPLKPLESIIKDCDRPCLKCVRFDSSDDDADYIPSSTEKKEMNLTDKVKDGNVDDFGYDSDEDPCLGSFRHLNLPTRHYARKQKILTQKKKSSEKSKHLRRHFREHVPVCRFKFAAMNWSPWHIAMCPRDEMKKEQEGKWKTILRNGGDNIEKNSLWRKDLFQNIPGSYSKKSLSSSRMMFEMAVMAPNTHRRRVVSYHITRREMGKSGLFRQPWYSTRGVFHGVRPMVNRAASLNCKLFIRWARVSPVWQKRCCGVDKMYNYAWKSQERRACF